MMNFFKTIKDKFSEDPYENEEDLEEKDLGYEEAINKKVNVENSNAQICYPRSYQEAQTITDNLLKKKIVLVNITKLNEADAQRFIDFLTGATYAIGGEVNQIANEVFMFSPKEIVVGVGENCA